MTEAWLPIDGPAASCLCQGMQQWCKRGMHQHCICPHRNDVRYGSAEAWLLHRDGSIVRREGGRWWCLWSVPKPWLCRLYEACSCNCHKPVKTKPAASIQGSLFAVSGAAQ